MTNKQFKLWINGYLVLSNENNVDLQQIAIIKKHAELVYITMGNIETDIFDFIAKLEAEIKLNSFLSFFKFKSLAESMMLD